MGLFFEDKKPDPVPVRQEVRQDWLTALIAGTFALAGVLLLATLRSLAFIARPVFQHLFTFDGRTREQITVQMGIAAALIGVPAYLIYQIPAVRDTLSLSRTHTINVSTHGQRIIFPDRAVFAKSERTMAYSYNGKRYISYAGYTDQKMEKASSGDCFMVERSERRGLHSEDPPIQAEGFEDKVTYLVSRNLRDLKGEMFFRHIVLVPERWWKTDAELGRKTVEYQVTSTWQEMVENWDDIWSPPGFNDNKPFEVKALAREHAIVCF